MPDQKTKPTKHSVDKFLENVNDEQMRDDCLELIHIMKRVTNEDAVLWGESIVGFGHYHYKYDSGHEGDACLVGFAPRKGKISVYLMPGFAEQSKYLEKLGKHKAAKGCLYIRKLSDVDTSVLEKMIGESVKHSKSGQITPGMNTAPY
jgi:hypothetical protein